MMEKGGHLLVGERTGPEGMKAGIPSQELKGHLHGVWFEVISPLPRMPSLGVEAKSPCSLTTGY